MDFRELFKESKKEINLADHIYFVTSPLIQDRKVLLNILKHLDKSILLAIRSFINKEKSLKKIRMIPSSDELATRLFFESYTQELDISFDEKRALTELNNIVKAHAKSQMGLKRGDDYVIILPDFGTITVNENNVKKYLKVAKTFINKIERGISNERIGNS